MLHPGLRCLAALALATLSASPAAAQRLVCEEANGRVGFDQDAHLGHALVYRDPSGKLARATVRYLVRIAPDCFTRHGISKVTHLSLWIHNGVIPEGQHLGGVPDCPAFVPRKRPIVLLYGQVHRRRMIDVRDLQVQPARVGKRGRWEDHALANPLPVAPDIDIVVGVEIDQEPGECPLVMAPPTLDNFGNEGSYLQIVKQEEIVPGGEPRWVPGDCDGNRIPDAEQGFAAHVRESLCGETVGLPNFQWRIRAKGATEKKR